MTFGLLPRVQEWFEDLGMSRGQKIVPPASIEAENPSTHVQDVQVAHATLYSSALSGHSLWLIVKYFHAMFGLCSMCELSLANAWKFFKL